MGKKKKGGGFVPAALLIVLILSIGAFVWLVWDAAQDELAIMDMEKRTVKEYVEKQPEAEDSGQAIDWDGLLAANKDVVGWLQFDEPSRINYPIVQGESNQTYLTRDWQGNYLSAGAIFLNKHNSPEFTDMNSVIYGHRMINGSMFGSLKKYSSQEFMDSYPYFYIYTPDGKKRTYEIFAYAQVQDGSGAYDLQFDTLEKRDAHCRDILGRAITKRDVELDGFDTTVTLSTCASRGYYERMVILGKLVLVEVE